MHRQPEGRGIAFSWWELLTFWSDQASENCTELRRVFGAGAG